MAEQHDQHRHRLRRSAAGSPRCAGRSASSSPSRRSGCTTSRPSRSSRPSERSSGRAFLLDVEDVAGKRIVETRLARTVTVREENAAAALEVMSRFADRPALADLPAADDVADRDVAAAGLLEHPDGGVRRVPRRGRRDGDLRGEAHGLARDRRRLPRRGRRARPLRRRHRRDRRALHPHRAPVLRRPRRHRGRCSPASARPPTRPGCGTSWAPTGCVPRLRAAAVVGEGDGAHPRQYAAVGAAGARRACTPPSPLEQAAARGLDVDDLLDRQRASASSDVDRYARRTAATSGRSTASTTCASRRSTCSPPRARVYVDRDHRWHLESLRRARRRGSGAGSSAHRPARRRRHRRRPARPRRSPGGRS